MKPYMGLFKYVAFHQIDAQKENSRESFSQEDFLENNFKLTNGTLVFFLTKSLQN